MSGKSILNLNPLTLPISRLWVAKDDSNYNKSFNKRGISFSGAQGNVRPDIKSYLRNI